MKDKYYVFARWTKEEGVCQGGYLLSKETEKEALSEFMANLFKTEDMVGWTLEYVQVLELNKK